LKSTNLDTKITQDSLVRDSLYVAGPIIVTYILEELLSSESLYYIAAWFGRRNPTPNPNYCCGIAFFQKGQPLYPSQDNFVSTIIQPCVQNFISPFQDWLISIFNYLNVLLFTTVTQLFLWVGMWDLFSFYIWPFDNTSYRDLTYCAIGFVMMFLSTVFFNLDKSYSEMTSSWVNGIPLNFGFKRKVIYYAREMLNFLGFLCVWVGAWDFLDTKLWVSTPVRDSLYFIVPIPVSFILEEILAAESLYYIAVKITKDSEISDDVDENIFTNNFRNYSIQNK